MVAFLHKLPNPIIKGERLPESTKSTFNRNDGTGNGKSQPVSEETDRKTFQRGEEDVSGKSYR
ncbi:MAG: hypothetical protein DDT41_00598 [candidate division WS2 bacterium]|nr:hypothetical protein [Candidatus Psychracetigena formicireducens]